MVVKGYFDNQYSLIKMILEFELTRELNTPIYLHKIYASRISPLKTWVIYTHWKYLEEKNVFLLFFKKCRITAFYIIWKQGNCWNFKGLATEGQDLPHFLAECSYGHQWAHLAFQNLNLYLLCPCCYFSSFLPGLIGYCKSAHSAVWTSRFSSTLLSFHALAKASSVYHNIIYINANFIHYVHPEIAFQLLVHMINTSCSVLLQFDLIFCTLFTHGLQTIPPCSPSPLYTMPHTSVKLSI